MESFVDLDKSATEVSKTERGLVILAFLNAVVILGFRSSFSIAIEPQKWHNVVRLLTFYE